MLPQLPMYVPARNSGNRPRAAQSERSTEPTPTPTWAITDDFDAPALPYYAQPPVPQPVQPPPPSNPQLDRLLALQATRERLKNEYCELMQALMQDPLLHAVYQEVRAGTTQKKQYPLGYGFFINAYGLTAVVDARGQIEYKELLRVKPDKFTPFSTYVGDFPGKDRAMPVIQARIQAISKDITSAYESASAGTVRRR